MRIRALTLALSLLAAAPAWALQGPAPAAATSAAPTPTDFKPGEGKQVHLGKIQVPGVKPLVETLQEIKLAVKRPFDNDPAHFDDMVCRLGDGTLGSHAGMTLECGTQGWFSMSRDAMQLGMMGGSNAVSTLGHPWHTIRYLSSHQLKTLRDLLRELPPPGQGEVQVIDDSTAPPTPAAH